MAVEAHHLHLFPPQLFKNREFITGIENQSTIYDIQMDFINPVIAAGSFTPFYNPVAPVTTAGSDSTLTVNNNNLSKKRSRDFFSFLGEDISSHIHHHMLVMDRLIVHHTNKVRTDLMEWRKRFSKQIMTAVEERVLKRLKSKDEEIEQITKLNWALEEKLKSLGIENQIWRYLAQTNEEAANALRTNLEQIMADQIKVKEEQDIEAEAVHDAESYCRDNWQDGRKDATTEAMRDWKRMCRNCNNHAPSVLLLPCRHMCLCTACGLAIEACPICKCPKISSVNVNLS